MTVIGEGEDGLRLLSPSPRAREALPSGLQAWPGRKGHLGGVSSLVTAHVSSMEKRRSVRIGVSGTGSNLETGQREQV